jgi:hypothetical protein
MASADGHELTAGKVSVGSSPARGGSMPNRRTVSQLLMVVAIISLSQAEPVPAQGAATTPDTIATRRSFFGPTYTFRGREFRGGDDLYEVLATAHDGGILHKLDRSSTFFIAGLIAGFGGQAMLWADVIAEAQKSTDFSSGMPAGVRSRGPNVGLVLGGLGLSVVGAGLVLASAHLSASAVQRFNQVMKGKTPVSLRVLSPTRGNELLRVSVTLSRFAHGSATPLDSPPASSRRWGGEASNRHCGP